MTMSALEVGMRADALVQLMRSDASLDHVRQIVDGLSDDDVKAVLVAFRWRGWAEENIPVPDRGHVILNRIAGLPDGA